MTKSTIRKLSIFAIASAAKLACASTTMEICSYQPVPDGWVVTSKTWNPLKCKDGEQSSVSTRNNVFTLTRPEGQPSLVVCGHHKLPADWVKTRNELGAQCREFSTTVAPSSPSPDEVIHIESLSGKAVLHMCSGQAIPSGWTEQQRYPQQQCGEKSDSIVIIRNGISCSLSVSSSEVQAGTNYSFSLSGQGISGYRAYWRGARNGREDAKGDYFGTAPGVYTYSNSYDGIDGNYVRYAEIRDSAGAVACTTNAVSVRLLPKPICTLSTSKSNVQQNESWTFSAAANNVPNDVVGYWYGTRDGVKDANGVYAGRIPFAGTFNNPAGSKQTGTYTRYLEVRSGSTRICTTNIQTVTLQ